MTERTFMRSGGTKPKPKAKGKSWKTLKVYALADMDDDSPEPVAVIERDTDVECLAVFTAEFDINDYCAIFA